MSRDVLKQLEDQALVSVRILGEDWPRGLLSGTPIPDGWLALLVKSDGRRRLAPAGEDPRPERGDKLILARSRPMNALLSVADSPADQGVAVDAVCELTVSWRPREDELAALERTLLAQPLTTQRLAEFVADGGGLASLKKFILARTAEALLRDDQREALLDAFRADLKKLAFDSGLHFDRIAKLEFVSEAYRRRASLERDTRRRVERIKASEVIDEAALQATQRRLGDLGGILEQLKSAAAGEDDTRWHQLLPALSPADRGKLLENLWRLTPDKTTAEALVVVSDMECLWIDPNELDRIARRVVIPDELGGLRSVTYSPEMNWLLIGAASGVWAVDAETGDIAGKFEVSETEPARTGFNAAVICDDRLYATSSQYGCWSWHIVNVAAGASPVEGAETPQPPKPILAPENNIPKRIRAVVATDDGRVLFAGDDCVHVYDPAGDELGVLTSGTNVIHSLAVVQDKLYVGAADAKLFRVDLSHPDDWWLVYQSNEPIETIQPRQWNDLVELVVPAGPRGVNGVYDSEGVTTRLLVARIPIRRAWACDDVVVGLNSLRDRLIVMDANQPERKGREAKIAQMTGRPIQDACIVTKRASC